MEKHSCILTKKMCGCFLFLGEISQKNGNNIVEIAFFVEENAHNICECFVIIDERGCETRKKSVHLHQMYILRRDAILKNRRKQK